MRHTAVLPAISLLLLAACGGDAPPVAAGDDPALDWEQFVTGVIAEYYERNPEQAVDAGLHAYDGRMADRSLSALEAYAAWIDEVIAAALAYDALSGIEAFERDYLLNAMTGELFWLRESGYPTSNPLFYAPSVSVYVDREYAPLEERIEAYTRYTEQLPGALATMRENLEPPLPAPYLEIGQAVFAGFADYLENTVPGLFAAVEDAERQRRFRAANDRAAAAVKDAAAWLDGLQATATGDYALGEAGFLDMLRMTQGVDISLAELEAAGEADLARNLEALDAACAEFAPGSSARDCVRLVQERKPPEGPVAGAARQLPALRQFVVDNGLVTIPSDEKALVAESPPHRRFNIAYISIPGPFEKDLPSVYYIAPPDPAWSEEDQRAYIPGETDLLAISVHEVWPGHFLQYLHANRADNNVGQHFGTYTFTEGWAHYTEEMMWEAGLGDGDPEVRIGQLINALLRNVRYLSAIGLHTGSMTVAESQALFEEKAFKDFGNASQQALRGTYDPGYLNYTLGKLMIIKLREDWTADRGGREAWGRFHDTFLSFGSPPIPLVREQMLGPDYAGDTALLPD
ncbi:MAG: DUF885 domain-containing protein [Woeseiaceae bacterium]|nr:DUF885 domain-containing protein [Woeseiaceae bacterium]